MKKIFSFIISSLFFFNAGAQSGTTASSSGTKVSTIAIKSSPVTNVLPSNNANSLRNQMVTDTNGNKYFIDAVGTSFAFPAGSGAVVDNTPVPTVAPSGNATNLRNKFVTSTNKKTYYIDFLGVSQVVKNNVNTVDWGADSSGVVDATNYIQNYYANDNVLNFAKGTYKIKTFDGVTLGVKPTNYSTTELNYSTLSAIPNNSVEYNVLDITSRKKVTIKNGSIIGDRYTHSGSTGEWGHGINIVNSDTIVIENVHVRDMWGDGIYLNNSNMITIINCTFTNCRRVGAGIINSKNVTFINCKFTYTNGTSPESGVDLENNYAYETNENIIFINCEMSNNKLSGIEIQGFGDGKNIKFDNCTVKNNYTGIRTTLNTLDVTFLNCLVYADTIAGYNIGLNTKFDIIGGHIKKCGQGLYLTSDARLNITGVKIDSNSTNGIQSAGYLNISKCIFRYNNTTNAATGSHIYLVNTSDSSTIFNNQFLKSSTAVSGYSIYNQTGSNGFINIEKNYFWEFSGIFCVRLSSKYAYVRNNHFESTNTTGSAIFSTEYTNLIQGNYFKNLFVAVDIENNYVTDRNLFRVNNNTFDTVTTAMKVRVQTTGNAFTWGNVYRGVTTQFSNGSGLPILCREVVPISNNNSGLIVELFDNAIPTNGSYVIGDRIRYSNPTPNGVTGAICTTSGTPGVWSLNYINTILFTTTTSTTSIPAGATTQIIATLTGITTTDQATGHINFSASEALDAVVTYTVTAANTVTVTIWNRNAITPINLTGKTIFVKKL